MTIQCFAKVDGIPGESKVKNHKSEIDVVSWHWSVENPGIAGGGGGAGKAVPGEFVFLHHYDLASPQLARACITGKHIKDVVVSVRHKGSTVDYLVVTMKEAIVTSVAPDAEPASIEEVVSISYRDIEFDYKQLKPNGSVGATSSLGWDVVTNQVR